MSRLDNIITELCPDGVEYKKLSEITLLTAGDRITKSMMRDDFEYPVMGGGTVPTGYYFDWNRENYITISRAGAAGSIGWHPEKFWATDVCFVAAERSNASNNIKFIYYAMKVQEEELRRHIYGGSIPKVNKKYLWNLLILIPPLPVQNEIVRILDTFTELTEELTARKKQYEYYRDKLLTFTDDVEYKRLGEIGTIVRGNGLQKKDFTKSGVGCIHYGQIYTYYGLFAFKTKSFVAPELATKLQKVQTGDIIITVTSENVNDICKCVTWLGKENIVTGGHTVIFKHNQNPKYVAYWLQSTLFYKQKLKIVQGTKVIDIQSKKLERVMIPAPSLPVQAEIVQILDRFYGLCNNLTHGLPAEIEARKKQYEYYRDKLLTFKQKE